MKLLQPGPASDAFGKLCTLNSQRLEVENKLVPPNNRLYHYTTAEGLKGIVEKPRNLGNLGLLLERFSRSSVRLQDCYRGVGFVVAETESGR